MIRHDSCTTVGRSRHPSLHRHLSLLGQLAPVVEPQVVKVVFNDVIEALVEEVVHMQAISFFDCQLIYQYPQTDLLIAHVVEVVTIIIINLF